MTHSKTLLMEGASVNGMIIVVIRGIILTLGDRD